MRPKTWRFNLRLTSAIRHDSNQDRVGLANEGPDFDEAVRIGALASMLEHAQGARLSEVHSELVRGLYQHGVVPNRSPRRDEASGSVSEPEAETVAEEMREHPGARVPAFEVFALPLRHPEADPPRSPCVDARGRNERAALTPRLSTSVEEVLASRAIAEPFGVAVGGVGAAMWERLEERPDVEVIGVGVAERRLRVPSPAVPPRDSAAGAVEGPSSVAEVGVDVIRRLGKERL